MTYSPLHYPSLELCKKLTEAGFPRTTMFTQQSSYFMENWYLVMNTKIRDEIFNPKCFENLSTTADMKKEIVYPSVMELLDDMPIKIKIQGIVYYELPSGGFISWSPNGIDTYDFNGTLPNALAEMYIWLKENNYLPTK